MAVQAKAIATGLKRTGKGKYYGFSVRETAGAAAVIRIYDGVTAAGLLLETLAFGPNECMGDFYAGGIMCQVGVYVDVVSGTVEGTVRID